jgi:hypothetical protein
MDFEQGQSEREGFYVQEECCTSCGVPQSIAPELVGWRRDDGEITEQCYWIRQPANADELTAVVKIIHAQELGCHRYAGNDPEILRRLPAQECDVIRPDLAVRWRSSSEIRSSLGVSTTAPKFSLSASERAHGMLAKLWRWLFGD